MSEDHTGLAVNWCFLFLSHYWRCIANNPSLDRESSLTQPLKPSSPPIMGSLDCLLMHCFFLGSEPLRSVLASLLWHCNTLSALIAPLRLGTQEPLPLSGGNSLSSAHRWWEIVADPRQLQTRLHPQPCHVILGSAMGDVVLMTSNWLRVKNILGLRQILPAAIVMARGCSEIVFLKVR